MEFGMPNLLETKSLEECASLCHELGLSFVELNMNFPEYQADRIDPIRCSEAAKRYGIYYTVHLYEKLDPCDFNELAASACTEAALRTIETCKKLDVPILNMHLADGVHITLPDRKVFLYDEYEWIYLQKLTAFRDACASAIADSNSVICAENTNEYERAPF
jgi:sugar phosphate isomerase/epimerase